MSNIITIELSKEILKKMSKKGIKNTEGQVEFIRNAMALLFYTTENSNSIYIKREGQKELMEIDLEGLND